MAKNTHNSAKIAFINLIRRSGDDYIIVQRGLLFDMLDQLAPQQVQALMDRWSGQNFPEAVEVKAESPDVHVQVHRLRKLHSISQEDLAKESGLKQPDISDFERNGPTGFTERRGEIVDALKRLIDRPTRKRSHS